MNYWIRLGSVWCLFFEYILVHENGKNGLSKQRLLSKDYRKFPQVICFKLSGSMVYLSPIQNWD